MASAIRSARYVNPEHTAAIIKRKNGDDALISEIDTPDLWAEMARWSGTATAYSEPQPEVSQTPVEKLAAFINANPDVAALLS